MVLLGLLSLGLVLAVFRLYRSSSHKPREKLPQAVPAATPRVTRPTRSKSTTLMFPSIEDEAEYDPHNINSTAQYSPVTPVLQANPWQPQATITLQPVGNGRRAQITPTSSFSSNASNGKGTPTSQGSAGSGGGSGAKKKKKRVVLNGTSNGYDREALLTGEERKEMLE